MYRTSAVVVGAKLWVQYVQYMYSTCRNSYRTANHVILDSSTYISSGNPLDFEHSKFGNPSEIRKSHFDITTSHIVTFADNRGVSELE